MIGNCIRACLNLGLLSVFVSASIAEAGYFDVISAEPELFAYWRFDGDTGADGSAARDEVGNNDGIYEGAVPITAAGGGAPIGDSASRAADFSDISSYINVGTLPDFGPALADGVTVEFWVKSSQPSQGVVFGMFDGSDSALFVNLDEDPMNNGALSIDDHIRVFGQQNGGSQVAGGTTYDADITEGDWNYFAATLEGWTSTIYVYTARAGEAVTREETITMDKMQAFAFSDDFVEDLLIGAVNNPDYADLDPFWPDGVGLHFDGLIDELALYSRVLSKDEIDAHLAASASDGARLRAGDANMDLQFNQLDLVQVQVAAKYLTGQAATWGEGDWNGAPGGSPGNPPPGNNLFDQMDIIAALNAGTYLQGPYAALATGGSAGDGQTSIGYDARTGEVFVDAPAGARLSSVNIDSASGIFTGDPAEGLGGSFDNDADTNIFKATFGSDFGSLSFGNVAVPGLSEEVVAGDLTVVGSLAGGGALGEVDLVYVPIPEPGSACLVVLGLVSLLATGRRRSR
jgi:hypothetical protein